jgi:hypothetical protein
LRLSELVLEVAEPVLLGGGGCGLLPQPQDLLDVARRRVAVSGGVLTVYSALSAIGGRGASVKAGLDPRRAGDALALVRGRVAGACGAVTRSRRPLTAADVREDVGEEAFPLIVDRFPPVGSFASEVQDLLTGVGLLLQAELRVVRIVHACMHAG